jgi:hypothetical protein
MIANIILGYILPFVLLVFASYLIKNFRDVRILKWVEIAVKAAEQMYTAPGKGKEKFDYVANWISEKFNIPKEDLKNLIESAVYEINSNSKGG